MKRVKQLFAALTLLLPLAGCVDQDSVPSASPTSDAASSEAPVTEVRDTLRMAMSTDPDGLDPHMTTSASTFQITNNIYEPLVTVDTEGNIIPALADSYEPAEDGMSITFHLREGAVFSNGNPADANAVKASFERLMSPDSARSSDYANISDIEVVDDTTITFSFATLDVSALSSFAYPWSAIVDVRVADSLKTDPVATDFFDGRIARKYNGFSEFGKLLDPIVDKIFAVGLTLAVLPKVPLLAINLIPEIAIAAINSKSFHGKGNPKSSILGKLKTFFLFPTIGLCYVSTALNIDILNILTAIACASTFAIQGITTYDYYKKAKEEKNKTTSNEIMEEKKEVIKEENFDKNKEPEKKETKEERLNVGLTRKEAIQLLKETKEEYFGKPKEEKTKTKKMVK